MKCKLLSVFLPTVWMMFSIFAHAAFGEEQTAWPISNDTSAFADTATSPFGPRDEADAGYSYGFHGGLDLRAPEGTPVHAILDGKVAQAKFDDEAGRLVRIQHLKYWFFSEYFHLQSYIVEEGDEISRGDTIGYAGKTGDATGAHLHLGIFVGNELVDEYDKQNPVGFLNYTNSLEPWIWPMDTYPLWGDYIDSMYADVNTRHNELDLNIIEVYLYHGSEVRKVEMNFNKQKNVNESTQGEITHFENDPIFEIVVRIKPFDFWPFGLQEIKVIVDPTNNNAFPNEWVGTDPKWMGIRFTDLDGKHDEWGNVSGSPVIPALSSFAALPLEKEIKVMWTLGRSSEAVGINLYRSKAKDSRFVKINDELMTLMTNDNERLTEYSFIDRDVLPGIEYFYKLAKVFKDGRTEFFSEVASAMIIPDFSLNQNYPNPFNTSTIISYDIDYESPVRTSLCIYNLLGQRVRSLLDEEKSAGHYQVEWDGTNEKGYSVSSGLYFYVLKADKSIDKKKMLLIK